MSSLDKVRQAIYSAIDEVNGLQKPEQRLEKSPETVLLGSASKLDSLGLVGFLVAVEQHLSSTFDAPITLASEKAFSLRNSPFSTVDSLTQYVEGLLQETSRG